MSLYQRRRALGSLLLLLPIAVLGGSGRAFSAESFEQAPVENRLDVIVAFSAMPGPPEEALVRAVGGQVRHRYHLVPAIAAAIPPQAVTALRANPRVTAVEADVRVFAVDVELDNSWGVKRVGAGPVHREGISGAGVKVAIIDSGIDHTHPDLALNYAGGYDFVNDDADPFDDNAHGTHVAGIVAARDDDAGVVGVAPHATLYALKVLDASGNGSFSSVLAALQWAVDNGVQVTNNSYGSSEDPGVTVQQAFANAEAAGILHVAASGNSGTCQGTGDTVLFPARYASVMAVAATDSLDRSPCFSSTGPAVELSAPGVAVNSTIPGGGYQLFSGTSMASPHVAGAAALVWSQGLVSDVNGNSRVNDEVRQRLIGTAQDLGAAGLDPWYGHGLVDAMAATGTPAPRDPAVAVSVSPSKSLYIKGIDASVPLTAVVKDEDGHDIAGLDASRFTTTVDGEGQPVPFAPASNGMYSGLLSLTTIATGSHAVKLVVADARDVSGSASTSFTVSLGVKAQSITYSTSGAAGKRTLSIAVFVVDPNGGAPVQGAKVTVHVAKNGAAYYGLTATTNSSGKATFAIKNAPSACYSTTVTGIAIVNRIWDQSSPANQVLLLIAAHRRHRQLETCPARQILHGHRGSRGVAAVREVAAVQLVEARVVGHVRQIDGDRHHVAHRHARGSEHGAQVGHDLLHLRLEPAGHQLAGGWIPRGAARHVQGVAHQDRRHEWRGRGLVVGGLNHAPHRRGTAGLLTDGVADAGHDQHDDRGNDVPRGGRGHERHAGCLLEGASMAERPDEDARGA